MFMAAVPKASSPPVLVALVLSLGACVGHFDGDREGPTATGGKGPPVVVPPPGKDDDPITGPIASAPGPSSRLVRLNHKQWANTVGDLFRLGAPATQAKTFLSESVRSSFDNNGSMLEVSPELWQDYQKAPRRSPTRSPAIPNCWRPGAVERAGDCAGRARAGAEPGPARLPPPAHRRRG
jgi:hypothetical protein